MIRAALHLSSYPPVEAHRDSVPVEPLSTTDFHRLSQSLSSSLFTYLEGILGSTPFVVGISISELDCGYQSEAGGHVRKSQQQKQWRKAENTEKKLHVQNNLFSVATI